jgi:hypothetical protein
MAKLTKQQALALLEKKIAPYADKGVKAIESWEPKVKATAKRLADAIKAADSAELVQTQANVLRLYSGKLADGTTQVDKAVQVIMKIQEDPELLELLADELTREMKQPTKLLEDARKTLEDAKKLLDQADAAREAHASDSKQARQEWAEAVAEVDKLCAGAIVESKAWVEWDKAANAAVAKRDRKELQRLQKAKPASTALDEIARRPAGMAFKEFDKEFKRDALAEDLRKEISRDRTASIVKWFDAQQAAKAKAAIDARVAALKIEPRDAAKALKALGFPGGGLGKLQAAIDLPDAGIQKALEALAKAFKVSTSGPDMMAALKKAGVL